LVNFWHSICPIFRKGHAEILYDLDGSNSLAYTVQEMTMNGRIVARFLASAVDDMIQNNRKEIRCPCRKCKQVCLIDPFSGHLKAHLLMHDFMDDYTRWISEDDVDVDGAEDEEGEDNNDEELEEGWNEEAPGHEEEDGQ
jgi:hypothetical protein